MEKATHHIIDIFISIVDNYGDMGFACEYIRALECAYPHHFEYYIWVDQVEVCQDFMGPSLTNFVKIGDIGNFGKLRKSAIGISMLHCALPDLELFDKKALILRIDYLSFDPTWLKNNEKNHILSTKDRQIIELIPSPLSNGAGLLPILPTGAVSNDFHTPHIMIFSYRDSWDNIDFESFPSDTMVYVCGKGESNKNNIVFLDFMSMDDFYTLLDTSELVIIRGEVSFVHALQSRVPFFWDMYKGIGGFPEEQSEQFLEYFGANELYRSLHAILNSRKIGKIGYQDMKEAFSESGFGGFESKNLIHTTKKYIDRFNNSI